MAPTGQLQLTYQYIRNLLSRAEMAPGTKLSRRRLAEEIGVSPALVQQALGQLEKEGIVERRPQSGTYVRELDLSEYRNLCDLRELIEPYAAARAAIRMNHQQIARLQKSCRRFRRCSERYVAATSPRILQLCYSRLVVEEQVFHGIILKASGNPLLGELVSNLRLLARTQPLREGMPPGRQLMIADEHEAICQALMDGDSEAAHVRMLHHIQGSRALVASAESTAGSSLELEKQPI